MTLRCRTCGGEDGNHKPSILDRNGHSHPEHKVHMDTLAGAINQAITPKKSDVVTLDDVTQQSVSQLIRLEVFKTLAEHMDPWRVEALLEKTLLAAKVIEEGVMSYAPAAQ